MTQSMTRHIALRVEFDGTNYHGFQVQDNAATIQGELEAALQRMTNVQTRVQGASRTDTGVHARGQVVSFATSVNHAAKTFVDGLNYYLPDDIAITAACEIAEGVDVRRQAISRRYRYAMLNQPAPSALLRTQSHHVRTLLDVETMDGAAKALVGEHDFASFSGPPSYDGQPTVRKVYSASAYRVGPCVYFDIVAESFLPQQVRRTVAQLLRIGKGKVAPNVLQRFLDEPVLGSAWEASPPHALCLEEIVYPAGLVLFTDAEQRVYAPAVVSLGV